MATPTSSAALAGTVSGLRAAKAAFQALPEITRTRMLDATETTVREIARGAQARLERSPSIRTRALYDHVRWQVTKTNGRGRVGIAIGQTTVQVGDRRLRVRGVIIAGRGGSARRSAGARVVRPTRYAHLVEFGSRYMPAEPFMKPAAEAEAQPYLQRAKAAGAPIERDVAAIGMRNL